MGVPRKIVQITTLDERNLRIPTLYALADDGSLWWTRCGRDGWEPALSLPDAPTCAATPVSEPTPCALAAGHRDQHWNGHRRWT